MRLVRPTLVIIALFAWCALGSVLEPPRAHAKGGGGPYAFMTVTGDASVTLIDPRHRRSERTSHGVRQQIPGCTVRRVMPSGDPKGVLEPTTVFQLKKFVPGEYVLRVRSDGREKIRLHAQFQQAGSVCGRSDSLSVAPGSLHAWRIRWPSPTSGHLCPKVRRLRMAPPRTSGT